MSVLDFMKKAVRRATGKKASRTGLRRVGTSRSHDTCDLCGKTGLKETVVMEGADGARVYYGSECASDAPRQTHRTISEYGVPKRIPFSQYTDPIVEADRVIGNSITILKTVQVSDLPDVELDKLLEVEGLLERARTVLRFPAARGVW